MPFKGTIGSNYQTFKNSLLSYSEILNVTAKNSLPTLTADKTNELHWPGKDIEQDFIIEATGVDHDYFKTMGINVVQGRDFSESDEPDKPVFVLNETSEESMGINNPVGTMISLWGFEGEVIGIAEDIQLKSMRNKTEAQMYYIIPDFTGQELVDFGVILIRIKGNIQDAISVIRNQWTTINPGIPFEYHFLDEAVDELYWSEIRLSRLMNYASLLSVVICCLGLLGLAIHNSNARLKEIGIRKINGATTFTILIMLYKNYIQWVLISFLIASPLAWVFLEQWLQNFAYRVSIGWWIFATSLFLTLIISILTISGQILKTARLNPVDLLRYE